VSAGRLGCVRTQILREALLYATGESQTEPAAALGVSQAQVSRRRSGTAAWSLADCDAVATHYGIDPLDLLAGPTRATETLPAQRRLVPGRGVRAATAGDGGAR
jgi:hypothetical protein